MRVRRLRLRWAGNQWETLADITLDRKTLRQSSVLPSGHRGGFWYELRDARGGLLYWAQASNPFAPSVELFEPDGSIQRVPIRREEAFIEVLIPDLPEAAQLQIFSDVSPEGEVQAYATMVHAVALGGGEGYGKDREGDDRGLR